MSSSNIDEDGDLPTHEVKIDVVWGVLGDNGPYLLLPYVAESDDVANDDAPPLFEGEAALVGDFEHLFPHSDGRVVCRENEVEVNNIFHASANAVQKPALRPEDGPHFKDFKVVEGHGRAKLLEIVLVWRVKIGH